MVRRGQVSRRYLVAKRGFDLAVCIWLLPVVAILMLLLALIIRLDSPGSILIAQERTGRDGRRFRMYKFRTMVRNAEELKAWTRAPQRPAPAGLQDPQRSEDHAGRHDPASDEPRRAASAVQRSSW